MLPEIAYDAQADGRRFLLKRLKEYGVQAETRIAVKKFLKDGVIAEKDGKEIRLIGFDTIVSAMGVRSAGLKEELEGKASELYVIGDVREPRKAKEAIDEGPRVASKL